ncbi:MAG: hypothetical protein WCF83_23875, partial [Pseudolabrys sp.]
IYPGFFFWDLGFSFGIFVTRALSVFRQKIRDAIYLRLDFTAFDYVDNYNSDKLRTNHRPQICAG